MIRAIPKSLLTNNCKYSKYIEDSGEGSTYLPAIILKNVRIEEQTQFNFTSNGKEIVGNAILFYDNINSSGLTDFTNESIIEFNGRKYTIKNIDILREFDKIHHYEVLLK